MLRVAVLIGIVSCSIPLSAQQSPASVEAPAGAVLLLSAKGDGAQIYTCTEGQWKLKAPDAKLLDAHGRVIGRHFAGPTWQLNDGSEVKGKLIANKASTDASSVPWLLLEAVPGSGSGKLANVTYIQRTETRGGAAPKEVCSSGEVRIPYTAKYSFYVAGGTTP
jgi:Protein of unknown function (DUF3455)